MSFVIYLHNFCFSYIFYITVIAGLKMQSFNNSELFISNIVLNTANQTNKLEAMSDPLKIDLLCASAGRAALSAGSGSHEWFVQLFVLTSTVAFHN